MKNLNIVLAVMCGALAGAAVGLLCAPEKGECTRNKIADYLKSKCPCHQKNNMRVIADEISGELNK